MTFFRNTFTASLYFVHFFKFAPPVRASDEKFHFVILAPTHPRVSLQACRKISSEIHNYFYSSLLFKYVKKSMKTWFTNASRALRFDVITLSNSSKSSSLLSGNFVSIGGKFEIWWLSAAVLSSETRFSTRRSRESIFFSIGPKPWTRFSICATGASSSAVIT